MKGKIKTFESQVSLASIKKPHDMMPITENSSPTKDNLPIKRPREVTVEQSPIRPK